MTRLIRDDEWKTFILKLRFDEADWDYDEGWHGHNDRIVMEWYEKAEDKVPVERLYFDTEYELADMLDAIAWEQGQ